MVDFRALPGMDRAAACTASQLRAESEPGCENTDEIRKNENLTRIERFLFV